jgi:Sulfotransferase family
LSFAQPLARQAGIGQSEPVIFKREPRARALFYLARSAGLAYLQIPKAACTSFKVAIALMNRPELYDTVMERPMKIHVRPEWSDIVDASDPAIKSLFRFTFVRNPLSRFLSFYRNKILEAKILPPEIKDAGFTLGMTMKQTLDRLEKTRPRDLDPHIAPQHWLVFDGKESRVSFIGQIERMDEDLVKLEQVSGIHLDVGRHNQSGGEEAMSFDLSPDEEKRIRSFYAEDYARLGYS